LARQKSEIAIDVKGLRKSYGDLEAVRGIDLRVCRGEIVALLGPNGAGKTTVVEILEGYRSRDGGEVEVLGVDPAHATAEWRGRLGMVLQSCQVEPELTVSESLELFAGYASSPRPVAEVLELVGLSKLSRRRAGALSGGEQRRLDVGIGLVGDPELLFLDEPTTGLDPAARHQFWEAIRGLRAFGKTVLLTTHYMGEAQALADRVAIMSAGLVVATGTPADLGGRHVAPTRITFSLPTGTALTDLPAAFSQAREALPGVVELEIDSPVSALGALLRWAVDHEYDLADLEVRRPTLEEVYLRLTQERPT
jgi:ABC-2 type transport system ATP-binding protein